MNFCPQCGTQIPEGTTVCPKCQPTANNIAPAKADDMKAIKKMFKKLYIIMPLSIVFTVLVTFAAAYFLFGNNIGNNLETVHTPKSDTVQATDNSFHTVSTDSICPEDEHGNHSWRRANCVEPAECELCGAYRDNKLGNHQWQHYEDSDSDEMFCLYCHMLRSDYENNE